MPSSSPRLRDAAVRWWLACAFVCSTLGCAAQPRLSALDADSYPGTLRDSTDLPAALFWRQRIEARFSTGSLSFEAVVQTDDGQLTLLALTPYGTRAFMLEQKGQRIVYTPFVDRDLPFPPRFILLDLHRAFFHGIAPAPRRDGVHRQISGGDEIVERWRGGRLWERRYRRLDGGPEGTIRIRYGDGWRPGQPPPAVTFDNGWFGYVLRIETLGE